jgi:peptide/nickel transport system substrate-binding protein
MEHPVTRARGGVLREGYDYDFSRVDPATGAHVDPAWCAIYETVVVADPDGQLGPMLAESWQADPDRLVWRFRIRPDARFHSGAPCDAAAVAAAFNLHGDPAESPVNAFFWTAIDRVEADGDDVVVRLHHPFAGLPSLLRSWHSAIHNQALRSRLGDSYGHGVAEGSGPFTLAAWKPGEVMEVTRWNDYPGSIVTWFENGETAHLDGVRWIPLLDETERAAALVRGDIDCVQNPSLLDVAQLQENPDLRVVAFQQSSLAYLALDHETEPLGFHDVRVRKAISHAIDRQAIVDRDLAGHGWPAYGPIPSASRWYAQDVERFNGYDPSRAEALLDEAGFPRGPDGVRLRFRALVLEDATVRRASRSLVELLARVGIALELQEVSGFGAFYGALADHPEAFISKWFWPDPVDAIIGFVSSWSHAGPNWQRASIPAIDAACRAWQGAPDETALVSASRDIQLLSAEHLPLVPLFSPATVWAHHRRVHGWRPTPTNLYPFYGDVWLEPA